MAHGFRLILLACLGIPGIAHADLPLAVETLVTDKGKFRLNLSLIYNNRSGGIQDNSDSLVGTASLRYGVTGKSEIYGRASYRYSSNRGSNFLAGENHSASYHRFVNSWLGASYRFKEDNQTPGLIGFIEAAVLEKHQENNSAFKSWAAGVTTYKSVDPIVFLLSASYYLNQPRRDGSRTVNPGNAVVLNSSLAFAVNDHVTLNTGLRWTNAWPRQSGGRTQGFRRTDTDLQLGVDYGFSNDDILNVTFSSNTSGPNGTSLRLVAGILPLAQATSTWAAVVDPDLERDINLAFENGGQPRQLALLSKQEMRETQGAVFRIPWIGRLFWGMSYGWMLTGYDIYDRGDFPSDIRTFYHIAGINVMAMGLIGLASTNHFVANALGFAGGHVALGKLREAMYKNDWTIFDAIQHANRALTEYIAGSLGEDGGAESMSAHATGSAANRYLIGLLATFPQDQLRQFLSDIPRNSFDKILSDIAPGETRRDFLKRLPPETVNQFLAAMPENHMAAFTRIIPAHLMTRITAAVNSQSQVQRGSSTEHWRY